jgi:CMP/dCMP kinase
MEQMGQESQHLPDCWLTLCPGSTLTLVHYIGRPSCWSRSLDGDENAVDIITTIRDGKIRLSKEKIYIGRRDVTNMIRTSQIDDAVSKLATVNTFRNILTDVIRQHVLNCDNAVVDGRDVGTVVFPDAHLKIYLDAALTTQADRRLSQHPGLTLRDMIEELRRRDERDTQRSVSPMMVPSNALIIDTTNLTVEDVLNLVINNLADCSKHA